jgi:hypothetical protein
MYDPGPADAGIYLTEEKEKRLRKMFFIDFPEQTGDTPPTLGQWLDEMARAQRRIGGPGASFYREGPAKIFLRFKFLLEAAGVIAPVKVDGRNVSLLPYNPAQRAAEQQEIATNVQAIQICSQAFPEEFKVQIDGAATMKALLDKMRAKLVTFRAPDQIKQALAQIAPLIKGHLGDTGQGAGAPRASRNSAHDRRNPVNPAKEEREALARIALTHDGLLLHRYLRRVLEGVILTTD